MEMLIIPIEIAEKLRQTEFPKPHALDPVKGEMDGEEVYFLQADLKGNKIFEKALADFEASEVKEIETIDIKYYDTLTKEEIKPTIVDGKEIYLDKEGQEIEMSTIDTKTILTASVISK